MANANHGARRTFEAAAQPDGEGGFGSNWRGHNMAGYRDQQAHRRITRRTVLRGGGLLAAGSAALTAVACGGSSSSGTSSNTSGSTSGGTATARQATPSGEQPVPGGTFTIASSDGGIFDPAMVIHGGTQTIEFAAYDKLNYFEPGFKITAAMAELPEQPDATTLIYKIKPNVLWHDKPPLNGRPFTAQDAAFGLQRFNDDNPQFIYRDRLSRVAKFEAVDATTLKLTLSQPFASLPAIIADDPTVMVSKDVIEAFGEKTLASDATKIAGTGPFVLTKRDANVEIVLDKNPKYYRTGQPYFDQYRTLWTTDDAAYLAAFVGGKSDNLRLLYNSGGPANWDAVQSQLGSDKVVKYDVPVTSTGAFQFNTKVKPYDDPRVRTALHLAVDRSAMVQIQNKLGSPAPVVVGGVLPSVMTPYGWTASQLSSRPGFRQGKDREQDLKDATALLRASGADLTNLPKVISPAGYQLIQAVQQNWKEIGFNVQIDERPTPDVLAARQSKNFSFIVSGLTGGGDPDMLFSDVHTTGGQNYGSFSDPAIDALLDKGRSTTDANERKKIYDEAQDKLLTNLNPRIWWGHYSYIVIQRSNIRGYKPVPTLSSIPIMLAGMWRKS
jgi:ABC-type transport system substrate-binding protein